MGLDPASRSAVCQIIAEVRPGRVVVLVTHDMAEVQALATRVAVLTHGRMRCLGDPQALTERYGGGYRLHLCFEQGGAAQGGSRVREEAPHAGQEGAQGMALEEEQPTAIRKVRQLLPCARLETLIAGAASLVLPRSEAPPISRVYAIMMENAARLGISDWSIAQESLGEVYEAVVRTWPGPRTT